MNCILQHAFVVCLDDELTVLEDGAVVVQDDTIVFVGKNEELPPTYEAFEIFDCSTALVMPSMINCHTHLGMVSFRTLGDDIADRLRRFLLPLENSCMHEQLAVASARVAIAEMQLSGISSAVDMYFFEDALAKVAQEMKFRLWGGETLMAEPHCSAHDGKEGLLATQKLIDTYQDNAYFTPIIAPHAPYSNTLEDLEAAHALAKKHNLLWTMHLSEMDFEMELYREKYDQTPIGFLASKGLLDASLLAVHCLHTSDEDLDLLSKAKTSVVHCPGANTKAAKGFARIADMREKGIKVCLGTDGPSSGNTLDLFTQMKLYAILQKNLKKDRTAIPAKTVVPLVTRDAAKILHAQQQIGSLEVGKKADLLILDLEAPNMIPCIDPYSLLVYSAGVQNVRHVMTNGEWVVRDHQLKSGDLAQIRKNFYQVAQCFFKEAAML